MQPKSNPSDFRQNSQSQISRRSELLGMRSPVNNNNNYYYYLKIVLYQHEIRGTYCIQMVVVISVILYSTLNPL